MNNQLFPVFSGAVPEMKVYIPIYIYNIYYIYMCIYFSYFPPPKATPTRNLLVARPY